MTDIIEDVAIDKDTVESADLEKLFNKKYNLLTETAVSLKKSYINKLDVTKSLNIAVTLQDNTIEVYKLTNTSLSRVCRLSGHHKSVTEVVFSPKEDYLLYSAGHDLLKLWDTRTSGQCVQEYKNETEVPREYESMDVSCTARVLCAGSRLQQDDAYLVFWDQRKPEPLGGYWNSHTDDVTQVKFHKNKQETLISGSSDGLINIYNIMEPNEDDALIYSMNCEVAVERLTWLDDSTVSCVTQSSDLQLWNMETGDMIRSYTRDKIGRSIKRSRVDDCYVVDAFRDADGQSCALAGSYGADGNTLRSVTISDKKVAPRTDYDKNKQIVRCCHYDDVRDLMVTTGESGLVSVWSGVETPGAQAVSARMQRNLKLHDKRHKPY
ncbi:WD repeat-containing protein 89 [Aricia agestis]|uniref:WD repeat-containing protein 89 n=1 Tax=Aricia agestis TaxID=91739 RepID=UPI001C2042AE|nr:WD repeat-containing protein 89 [Aricia agestis]